MCHSNHLEVDYMEPFQPGKTPLKNSGLSFSCFRWTWGGSRTAATSKLEHFVIIVNGWKPLTIISNSSILVVAAVLDPPLWTKISFAWNLHTINPFICFTCKGSGIRCYFLFTLETAVKWNWLRFRKPDRFKKHLTIPGYYNLFFFS